MRKVLESAKDICNEDILKKEHKVQRDDAVNSFKGKAVGQDISGYESQLRDGLSKKYKDIRNEFLRFCRTKAISFLEEDVNVIKRNI